MPLALKPLIRITLGRYFNVRKYHPPVAALVLWKQEVKNENKPDYKEKPQVDDEILYVLQF